MTVSVALSPAYVLKFDVCGGFAEVLANAPLLTPLVYQFSKSSHGPWKTLGVGKTVDNGSCAAEADRQVTQLV